MPIAIWLVRGRRVAVDRVAPARFLVAVAASWAAAAVMVTVVAIWTREGVHWTP